MTLLDDRDLAGELDEADLAVDGVQLAGAPRDDIVDPDEPGETRPAFVVGAAALASLAAAFMAGGLFRGGATPRLIAAAGVAVGAGLAFASTRFPRGAVLQYAVLPVAAITGAALVAPSATGGTANLPNLVRDALQGGGLLQPPVPFEPGWRFILVVLLAVLASSATSAALALRRPRLAVAIPAPVVLGGALLQPEGSELVSSVVAGILTMAGLALAYGADLPRGDTNAGATRFEARRLGRGVGLMALLVAVLVALSQASFLFPEPDAEPVVPPRRPPAPQAEPDRVLFSIDSARPGPWRVGVLDGYDGEAFLLPPLDPKSFLEIDSETGDVPGAAPTAGADRQTETLTFRIADVRGGTLPGPGFPTNVRANKDIELDPRTQVLRLPSGRPAEGFTYRVTAPAPPDGRTLVASPPAPPTLVTEFTAAPQPPNEVVTLLNGAPTNNAFDRLQFVRQGLLNNIIAAGAGRPKEVTPARVGAMLRPGAEATPYEITAAEVLIARWAGIPARLGFGFFGGETPAGAAATATRRTYRPKHGAAWLEAYFEGSGWVPLVGTPPKAKASLSDEEKRTDPSVSAAQELALVVYVPVELETIELLYQRVRTWASIALPLLGLLALASLGWPAVAKMLRRSRRQRWATERGPTARVWVAYAELRDRALDINVGKGVEAPLEFLAAVAPDDEHEELAWLVTRVVWGDLRRDVVDDDAVAAEDLARSVARRLVGAQPIVNRVAGLASRVSLRRPYAPELPNVSWAGAAPVAPAARVTFGTKAKRVPRRARALATLRRVTRPRTVAVTALVVVALVAPLFVPVGRPARAETPSKLPDVLPTQALGYEFAREARLERNYRAPGAQALASGGRVFTIRKGTVVAGSFQVAVLRPDVDGRDRGVQADIEKTLQTGGFETRHFGAIRLRTLRKAEQVLWVWFPPERNVMELFVLRADVADGAQLVREVIRQQLRLPLEAPR